MTYYAGLDVSLRTVNICVIDDQGELVAETKLASEVQDIVAYLDELELALHTVRPMLACGWLLPVPTAKRSVTHAKTRPSECHKTGELDIYARLEKQTFAIDWIMTDRQTNGWLGIVLPRRYLT